ncbi:Calcium channel flower [Aphelenchoides besseyi]|nr:Calcium channel flower [Aphelenchoides besseyi]KAI6211841.1 Calcium channel flower [Aphelenchoides besseyi]
MNAPLSWWARVASTGNRLALLARILGLVGGFLALLMGFIGFFTIDVFCMIAALTMLGLAVAIIVLEGAFFLSFLSFAKPIANFSSSRPYWQKAVFYCISPVIPFFLCIWWHTFFGGFLILGSGIVYAVMAFNTRHAHSSPTASSNPTTTIPNPFTTNPTQQYPPPPTSFY